MKLARLFWTTALAIGVYSSASALWATTVPVQFESGKYTVGAIGSQDGWVNMLPSASTWTDNGVEVISSTFISGSQSLQITGNGPASGTTQQVRAKASGILSVDGVTPHQLTQSDVVSWLVRIDNAGSGGVSSGSGTANLIAGRSFETGLVVDTVNGVTIATVGFRRVNNALTYYNGSTYVSFSDVDSNPLTYSTGIVYRVEVSDINPLGGGINGTLDIAIYNNDTNTELSSVDNLAMSGPLGTGGFGFYALQRNNNNGLGLVDNVTITTVPEPTGMAMIALGGIAMLFITGRSMVRS